MEVFGKPVAGSRIPERRWLDSTTMDDGSASVFCFTPPRVTVSERDRLRAAPPSPESLPGPICSAPSLPQGPCPVCPRLEQEFEPWRQASSGQAMHRRALEREAQLQAEVDRLQALLRRREQQLFGQKTEAAAATEPAVPLATPTRRRGPRTPPRAVPLFAVWPARRGLPGHRGFDRPGGRGPGPSPGHPPPPLSADLLLCRLCRHRHRPAAAPADPQEHPGGLDLGDPALG